MHILVTDATGTVGRMVARQLIAAGHTISGIAEHPHVWLDPRRQNLCAHPLSDPILQELADEADAIIHLAPVDTTAPGNGGIDGVARVTHAAARAGARLLFVSQTAGRPAPVSAGRGVGVHGLGTKSGHPDRAAGRPPARLDGVPHGGHAAAHQGLGAADAGAASRRPGPFPGHGAEHRPHRCGGPGLPGHHQSDHRVATAAIRRSAFAAASGSAAGPS